MTSFKPPFSSQLTPHAEINNFIKNTEEYLTGLSEDLNTAFAEVPQMSETPQRIGTWIDGTPIWRKAFRIKLADLSQSEYERQLSRGFEVTVCYSDLCDCYYLGGSFVYAQELFSSPGSQAAYFDCDNVLALKGSGLASPGESQCILIDPGDFDMNYEDLNDEGLYGYIDFACDEEYIRPGDDE